MAWYRWLTQLMCVLAWLLAMSAPALADLDDAPPIVLFSSNGYDRTIGALASSNASLRQVNLIQGAVPSLLALPGGRVLIPDAEGGEVTAIVRPFEIVAQGARFRTTGDDGVTELPRPDISFFRGRLADDPSSVVVLGISPRGVYGFVQGRRAEFRIAPSRTSSDRHFVIQGYSARRATSTGDCQTSDTFLPDLADHNFRVVAPDDVTGDTQLICRVALDADYEFFDISDSAPAAADYLLITYAIISNMYQRDNNIALSITHVNIWTTPSDPYTATTLNGLLYQFASYWAANNDTIPRDVALLAQARLGGAGGLAYLNGLLSSSQAYAVGTTQMDSEFGPTEAHGDAYTMGHELGHLLGSPHTHSCYWQSNGYLPSGALIDSCLAGATLGEATACFSGSTAYPPDKGTLMSYCHTPVGYQNTALRIHPICVARIRSVTEGVLSPSSVQPPIISSVTPSQTGAMVSWSPSETAGITRYDVYRRVPALDPNPLYLGSTNSSTYIYLDPFNYGLTETASYSVVAATSTEESPLSGEVTTLACMPLSPLLSSLGGSSLKLIRLADFNNDGVKDLAALDDYVPSDRLIVAMTAADGGYGGGEFLTPSITSIADGLTDMAIVDINDDGILDVLLSDANAGMFRTLIGQGTGGIGNGTFAADSTFYSNGTPKGIIARDFNEDGIVDVALASNGVDVFLGTGSDGVGNGAFDEPVWYQIGASPGYGQDLVSGDFNEDGILDLVVTDPGNSKVHVLLGEGEDEVGDGTFGSPTAYTVSGDPTEIGTFDLNRDGIIDLVVTCPANDQVAVLLGDGLSGVGDGAFGTATLYDLPGLTGEFAIADWYSDGIPDLVAAGNRSTVSLVRSSVEYLMGEEAAGSPNGTLAEAQPMTAMNSSVATAVADLYTDGVPDLIVAGAGGNVAVFPGNCWRTNPGITVQTPNGSEEWEVGSKEVITWTRQAGVLAVNVELSRDGGSHWEVLAQDVVDTSHVWLVVPPTSSNARIRVVDTTADTHVDVSNSSFEIIDSAIRATCRPCDPCDPCTIQPAHFIRDQAVSRDLVVELSIPSARTLVTELFDVAGRRLARQEIEGGRTGRQRVDLGSGLQLRDGIYFIRLTGREDSDWMKVILLRQ